MIEKEIIATNNWIPTASALQEATSIDLGVGPARNILFVTLEGSGCCAHTTCIGVDEESNIALRYLKFSGHFGLHRTVGPLERALEAKKEDQIKSILY